MSTLDNILKLLNQWPAWKRITEAPDRVDAMEARVAELESKFRRAPGEACQPVGHLSSARRRPNRTGDWGVWAR